MKKRLKPLLPALKEKKRYLAFEVISDNHLTFNEVDNSINHKLKDFLGILGLANAGINILKENWNSKQKKGIIRVNNKYVHQLKSCFLFINSINEKKAVIKSIGLSGAINKMKKLIKGGNQNAAYAAPTNGI